MSYRFTPEQLEFQRSLKKFFTQRITSEYLRQRLDSKEPSDQTLWLDFEALGIPSFFAETDPDLRAGFRELALLALESGAALLPECAVDAVLAGPYYLTQLLSNAARKSVAGFFTEAGFSAIEQGQKRIAVAPFSDALSGTARVSGRAGGLTVSGTLGYVPGAASSDYLIFFENGKKGELEQYGIDLSAPGVTIESHPVLDQTLSRTTITLEKVPCTALDTEAAPVLLSLIRTVRALELSGVCRRAVEMTVEYAKTRKQFGVPIGSFQAVQHKIADMHVLSESMRALAFFGAWAADHSRDQLELTSRSALHYAVANAPKVIESAIQAHGGIGFTWEYDLHLYLRRAKSYEALFASSPAECSAMLQSAALE